MSICIKYYLIINVYLIYILPSVILVIGGNLSILIHILVLCIISTMQND